MRRVLEMKGGAACAANQVCYSLGARGIDHDLRPWQRKHGVPVMAYCPIDQGSLALHAGLAELAGLHRMTAAQLALAWTMRDGDVIAIPKAVRPDHLRDNWAAAKVVLPASVLAALDRLFPPPSAAQPLAIV
jgi:diketogulonate reductase-like aldo/keto reductase